VSDNHLVKLREFLVKYNFTDLEVKSFTKQSTFKEAKKNTYLFQHGHTVDKFMIVVEGDSYYSKSPTNELDGGASFSHIPLTIQNPVNVAGSYAVVISQQKYIYSVQVKNPAVYFEFSTSKLDIIKNNDPAYYSKILNMLQKNSTKTMLSAIDNSKLVMIEREKTIKAFLGMLLLVGLYIIYFRIDENLVNATRTTEIIMMNILLLTFATLSVCILKINGRSLSNHGVTLKNTKKSIVEALIFATPFIIVCCLAKYILTISPNTIYYGDSIIKLPSSYMVIFDILIYSVICYVQEFIARGTLQSILERILPTVGLGLWSAILFSNFLFFLMHVHYSLLFGAFAFVFGIFWGYIYSRTRNLIGVSLHHAMISVFPMFFLDIKKILQTGSFLVS
jgi:membrane protease YdiL (CAAX protease family)